MRDFRRTIKSLWALCCLLTVLSGGAEVWAQSSGQKIDAVRQRMEDGLALFVGGDPAAAAKVFEAGYEQYAYSAFLFNAGVCFEKLAMHAEALAKYQDYMRVDPDAPDIDEVRQRVAKLEAILAAPKAAPDEDGLVPPPPPPPTSSEVGSENMRSLVVIESEPAGAPVRVFRPKNSGAPPYALGGENSQWTEIITTTAPTSISLSVGIYHIVLDKFADFNASDTQLRVSPGHVHHFKANLSQGVFMSFLRVSSNVKGAHIWLDDASKSKPEWGTTPYGELVTAGAHDVLVSAPGFQPLRTKVELQSGERKEIEVKLARVDYGFLRVQSDAPEIKIMLDGQLRGSWKKGDKPYDVRASAGKHQLVVTADGRKDFEGELVVPKGQVLPVKVKMIPKYPRGSAWTQSIIAAGLIGGGVYFGLESERLKDDLETERRQGTLQADDSRITKGRWYAIGADVGFAAGGVLAVLATWNFIKDPLPESSALTADPVEFADPLKKRPTAQFRQSGRVLAKRAAVPARPRPKPTLDVHLAPAISGDAAGLFLGGTF